MGGVGSGRYPVNGPGTRCRRCGQKAVTWTQDVRGRRYYKSLCRMCAKKVRKPRREVCTRCGFVPEHPIQLEVDHIIPRAQGGTSRPENLQTLCANCHRLKTLREDGYGREGESGRALRAVPPPDRQLPLPAVGDFFSSDTPP